MTFHPKTQLALAIALSISLVLALVLVGIQTVGQWPEVEAWPKQGEAAESGFSAAGQEVRPRHASHAMNRLIREPQNTWSSLGFVFAGAWLFANARLRGTPHVGIALIATGTWTFLYHASASESLRRMDVWAMYWLYLATAIVAVEIIFSGCPAWTATRWFPWVAGGVCAGLAAVLTSNRGFRIGDFQPFSITVWTGICAVTLVLALVTTCWRAKRPGLWGQTLLCVLMFPLAVWIRSLDTPGGPFYDPHFPIQLHAVWHLLSAGAFFWAVGILDSQGCRRAGSA